MKTAELWCGLFNGLPQRSRFFGTLWLAIPLARVQASTLAAEGRKEGLRNWTISDSVQTGYYAHVGDPLQDWPSNLMGRPKDVFIQPSPNHKFFFFIGHRDNIDGDKNKYYLSVYAVRDVVMAIKKDEQTCAAIAKAAFDCDPSIYSSDWPVWDCDSRTIAYRGIAADGTTQVHALDIANGTTKQLTHVREGTVSNFVVRNGAILFSVTVAGQVPHGIDYPLIPMPRNRYGDLNTGTLLPFDEAFYRRNYNYCSLPGKSIRLLQGGFGTSRLAPIGITPDGKKALVSIQADRASPIYPTEKYAWIDLENGQRLSNKPSDAEITAFANPKQPLGFGSSDGFGPLSVDLRDGPNELPRIVAAIGKRELVLDEINSMLKGVWISPEERLRWRESNGEVIEGSFALPRITDREMPLPVVIQIFNPSVALLHFLPNAPLKCAMSTQLYVANGLVVLNVPIVPPGAGEGPRTVKRLEMAVKTLSRRFAIDQTRIAAVGFSRTGYQVHYMITHSNQLQLAAGIIDASFQGSYHEYLAQLARVYKRFDSKGIAVVTHADRNYFWDLDSAGFWKDRTDWLEHETTFNTDRIRAPVLLVSHGMSPSSSGENLTYTLMGALLANERTFDQIFLPHAFHEPRSPREREALLAWSLDWLRFWLQDTKPSDPERAARWSILRKQQDEVLKTPPPPKGKWVFQADAVQPAWTPPQSPKTAAGLEKVPVTEPEKLEFKAAAIGPK